MQIKLLMGKGIHSLGSVQAGWVLFQFLPENTAFAAEILQGLIEAADDDDIRSDFERIKKELLKDHLCHNDEVSAEMDVTVFSSSEEVGIRDAREGTIVFLFDLDEQSIALEILQASLQLAPCPKTRGRIETAIAMLEFFESQCTVRYLQ